MTTRRCDIVDAATPGIYHCISRCVRREPLLDDPDRRTWIIERLRFLANFMAIDVISFSVMRNHLHLLLSIRPDVAAAWSDREVAERRLSLHVNKRLRRRSGIDPDSPPTAREIRALMSAPRRLAGARRELSNLGVFHRLLKEPCARLWNKLDGVKGHFWEGRYQSLRVLDLVGLVYVARYVELNEVHAGAANSIPQSVWSSAALQFRRLQDAASACIDGSGESLSAEAIAARLCALQWQPVFPCRTKRRDSATSDESSDHEVDRTAAEALGMVDRSLRLVMHLESAHDAGTRGRPDKRGRISSLESSPTVMSLRLALKSSPYLNSGDAAPTSATHRPQCHCQSDLERLIQDVLRLIQHSDRPLARCFTDPQDPDAHSIRLRGSCYGTPESVAQEANRRGLRRLWSGLLRAPPDQAA